MKVISEEKKGSEFFFVIKNLETMSEKIKSLSI
jgi:hypothetical protein